MDVMIDRSRLTATYSLAVIDRTNGVIGVGVQSHAFAVGAVVPWTSPGRGVVLTQALVNLEWGPRGLALLADGLSAEETLSRLVADDPDEYFRQGAVIDIDGSIAVHTGARCISWAGHAKDADFVVLANMMADSRVPQMMCSALLTNAGLPVGDRVLAALEAAEEAGGDIRGMQSAAMKIVAIDGNSTAAEAYPLDIRVDDNDSPLVELRRLYRLAAAYRVADEAETLLTTCAGDEATRVYDRARQLAPELVEIRFWEALSYAAAGRVERARDLLASLTKSDDRWRELARRLPPTGLVTLDSVEWDSLLAKRPGHVYHLCSVDRWETYDGSAYVDPSLADIGFIHAAYAHQIPGVIERYFNGVLDVVALEIAPERTGAEVRDEDLLGEGETFPHIFGPIPDDAIVNVHHELHSIGLNFTI